MFGCVRFFLLALPLAAFAFGASGSVGADDILLIQAMLRVVHNPAGKPYIFFSPDGELGPLTKAAIEAFQRDKQVSESPLPLRALRSALPNEYLGMRVLPGSRIVYFEASASDAAKAVEEVQTYADFHPDFKRKIIEVMRRMYSVHGIVLWVTWDGWRRGFNQQAKISRRASWAGPGESSHHYGRACDLGFRNLRFLDGNGAIRNDDDWLQLLNRQFGKQSDQLWQLRNAIAFPLGLHGIAWEKVHLQLHVDEATNNARSLVRLLNLTSTMRWDVDSVGIESHYLSDLGRGGAFFPVGTAREIWAEMAAVKPPMGDLRTLRGTLKTAFAEAERNWQKWEPVP